jgi:CO/xanthine dehydrogenase FAD-binding subunit
MKPPPFDYARPESVDEAVALLAQHGGGAKILAGGQSLVPLLNFRLLRPTVLIDINRLTALAGVDDTSGGLRIGALTRHHALETSPLVRERFPFLTEAMAHVAHLAVRNRGTIGGSLAHADPAAELPMIAVLLDAEIHTRAPGATRVRAAADFFCGALTTALGDDELVTGIVLPALPSGTGSAFAEVARRHGDFAIAAAAAAITLTEGTVTAARLAVTGVDETPLRLRQVEAELVGRRLTTDLIAAATAQTGASVDPASDLHASSDYRRHLVGVLTEEVLTAAWSRAA